MTSGRLAVTIARRRDHARRSRRPPRRAPPGRRRRIASSCSSRSGSASSRRPARARSTSTSGSLTPSWRPARSSPATRRTPLSPGGLLRRLPLDERLPQDSTLCQKNSSRRHARERRFFGDGESWRGRHTEHVRAHRGASPAAQGHSRNAGRGKVNAAWRYRCRGESRESEHPSQSYSRQRSCFCSGSRCSDAQRNRSTCRDLRSVSRSLRRGLRYLPISVLAGCEPQHEPPPRVRR